MGRMIYRYDNFGLSENILSDEYIYGVGEYSVYEDRHCSVLNIYLLQREVFPNVSRQPKITFYRLN